MRYHKHKGLPEIITNRFSVNGTVFGMLRIKTIQKENKARAGYAVVVPLRSKEDTETKKSFLGGHFGIFSRSASVLLIGLFFFSPVLDAYADEIPSVVESDGAAEQTAGEQTVSPDEAPKAAQSEPAEKDEQETPILTEAALSAEDTEDPPSGISVSGETASTETPDGSTPILEAVTEMIIPAETATATEPVIETETIPVEAAENVVPADEKEDAAEESETAEISEIPPETPAMEIVREDAGEAIAKQEETHLPNSVANIIEEKYLFRENECTRLDDGGFYCAPRNEASTTAASSASLSRVFVENDGDKEIFFEDERGKRRITDNDFDDDAPSYDKQSGFIAWHSLVKGRFQIMLYDFYSSTTKQLTDAPSNSTDPKVRGKSVVWQGWGENNWEIFYIQDVTAPQRVIEQITANENPDMFPIISDNFITWQSFFGDSWHVSVYNIASGETSRINRPEGGRYENPRFALLFEKQNEDGGVETVGYDVLTGKEIPIRAPHSIPSDSLPEQKEKDQAVPVPAGQSGASTTPMKNPGKDDEGEG